MGVQVVVVPDDGVKSLETLMQEGAELKTALAGCELRLYKAGVVGPTFATSLAVLDENEADYDGYTAGGVTVAAVGDPYEAGATGGVLVTVPSVQFNYVDAGGDPNEIGGAYLVDANGKLRGVAEFAEPVTMANNSNSIVVSMSFRLR